MEEDVRTSVDVQTGNLAFDILNQIYILGLQPGILQRFKRDQFINGSLVFCDTRLANTNYRLLCSNLYLMLRQWVFKPAVGFHTACSISTRLSGHLQSH